MTGSQLASYLEGMGVRHCFVGLYGPDLVDTFKDGPAFYERLLDDAAVSPANAVVVDDSPQAIAWAARVGAKTVLVSTAQRLNVEASAVIGSLRELPEVVDQMQGGS